MQHSLILCLNFARELSLLGDANEHVQVSFFGEGGLGKDNFPPLPRQFLSLCALQSPP